MQVAFEGEIIHTQYCIDKERLDIYFPKCKVGIEIDEYEHEYRDLEYEQVRKINDRESWSYCYSWCCRFNINIKKSLINNLSKRLLELEFKSNHLIKSKCLKLIVKKYYPQHKDMKSTQSRIKPIKTGK